MWSVSSSCIVFRTSNTNWNRNYNTDVRTIHSDVYFSGIGQGRVTKNVDGAPVDYALLIKDTEAVEMVS